jgi:translocation and assembly module TamB
LGTVTTLKSAQIDKVDFENIRSKFEFSPTTSVVTLKDIQGKPKLGGEVTGSGTVKLGQEAQLNFNLTAKNVPGDAIALVYDIKPTFQINTLSATAQLTGSPGNVQTVVQFQAPQATYPGTGELVVAPDSKLSFRNVALSVAGGTVQVYGNLANQRFSAVAQANGVQVEPFVDQKQLENVSLKGAEFNGSLIIKGTSAATLTLDKCGQPSTKKVVLIFRSPKHGCPHLSTKNPSPFQLETIDIKDGGVKIAGGTVAVSNIQLQEQNFSAQLVANGIRLSQILKQYPPVLQAPLAGTFQIAGNRDNLSLKTLQGTGEAHLTVGGGTVTAKNIQLKNGVYQTKLLVNHANVQELAQIPKQIQGQLTGDFNVVGTVDSFQLPAIQATGQARLAVGKGIVTASNIQLANGIYQTQLQTTNVPLQRLAQIPKQFYGNLNGQFNVAGSVESLKPETVQAIGQGRLNVDNGGTITASNIQLANGRYQAAVDASGLPLNQFSRELRGGLNGKLQVAGTTESFNIANIQAAGQVQLTQGIAGIEQPITAVVGWNGDKLNVERATARDFNATGEIGVKSTTANLPEITALNLNVQAQNYSLRTLNNLPSFLSLGGTADFSGQVTGSPIAPNLVGQIRLQDLTVNKFAFEPTLSGNIQSLSGRSEKLDVSGTQDKITLNLDGNNRPNSFLVKWQQALATGQSQGDNLAVKVENFPLTGLNLTPPLNARLGGDKIAGSLTGDILVNQKTLASATGNIAIAKPEVGRIKGDRLLLEFDYNNGIVTLANSEFFKGLSRYGFAGSFRQTGKSPQVKGNLNVDRGNVQDILTALQLFDFQDFRRGMTTPSYGNAGDLNSESVGLANQPKIVQLERYYEIQALLDKQQQQRRDVSPVPELADLKGIFNGSIDVDTATESGLFAKFNLNGKNFAWGREDEPERYFRAEQIVADGSFENGVLRFLPLRIESNKRLVAFTGNIGGDEQSGQLRVNNFPLKLLKNFVKLPVGLTGNLNGTATVAGNIANPKAKGELQIIDGTLNQKGIQSASASFSYGDGRLNFGSSVSVSGPQPVSIDGSIPYQLPFASTAPDSNQIALNVNVKNEGLALLNLFTNQVAFDSGEGEVKLTISGTREQPIVDGIATLNNAIFSAQALPGKLTDVTGKAQFDFDRILVENLEAKFSRGKIQAAGEIPIFSNQEAEIKNPLRVSLEQLALNLKGIYQGGASGNLEITGAALSPIIGGNVKLQNGQVLLSETNSTTPENRAMTPLVKQLRQSNPSIDNTVTRFNNLELELGNNVQIIRPPLLNFLATGRLSVDGSLNDLLPTGKIKLEQGGVNLFTTQFKLARNYEHTATFSQGLDPDLDIKLFARVLSAIRSIDLGRRKSGTEPDRLEGLAALETVRVDASVKGPASKLNENLELTSSPTRSQPEIVALLGGGFVDTQGRGDSTLGLINIAGSAVLSNFQGTFSQIANAFGLSDFRVFPTIISEDPEAGRGSSSLELAAEAGIDISPKVSVSTIKILTADDAAQWGLNYRINDEFRFRTSTNLFDDSRAVLEFESRF